MHGAVRPPCFQWLRSTGSGRVYQVESGPHLGGPYQAISPVMTGREWTVPVSGDAGWYRVLGG
jgi:hypothetical protein